MKAALRYDARMQRVLDYIDGILTVIWTWKRRAASLMQRVRRRPEVPAPAATADIGGGCSRACEATC